MLEEKTNCSNPQHFKFQINECLDCNLEYFKDKRLLNIKKLRKILKLRENLDGLDKLNPPKEIYNRLFVPLIQLLSENIQDEITECALDILLYILHLYPESFYFSYHPQVVQIFQKSSWKNSVTFLKFFCVLFSYPNIVNYIIISSNALNYIIEGFSQPNEDYYSYISYILLRCFQNTNDQNLLTQRYNHVEFAFKAILKHLTKTKNDPFVINSLAWFNLLSQHELAVLFDLYDIKLSIISIILSSNPDIQISAVQLLFQLTSKSKKLGVNFSNSDLPDFLIEALNTSNQILIESIFECFLVFPNTEVLFFCLKNQGMKKIINKLQDIIKNGSTKSTEIGFLLVQRYLCHLKNNDQNNHLWKEINQLFEVTNNNGKYFQQFFDVFYELNGSKEINQEQSNVFLNMFNCLKDIHQPSTEEHFKFLNHMTSITFHESFDNEHQDVLQYCFEKIQKLIKTENDLPAISFYFSSCSQILPKIKNPKLIVDILLKDQILSNLIEYNQKYKDFKLERISMQFIVNLLIVLNLISEEDKFKYLETTNPNFIFSTLYYLSPQKFEINDEEIIITLLFIQINRCSFQMNTENIKFYIENLFNYQSSINFLSEQSKRFLFEMISWFVVHDGNYFPSIEIQIQIEKLIKDGLNISKCSFYFWNFVYCSEAMKDLHSICFHYLDLDNLNNLENMIENVLFRDLLIQNLRNENDLEITLATLKNGMKLSCKLTLDFIESKSVQNLKRSIQNHLENQNICQLICDLFFQILLKVDINEYLIDFSLIIQISNLIFSTHQNIEVLNLTNLICHKILNNGELGIKKYSEMISKETVDIIIKLVKRNEFTISSLQALYQLSKMKIEFKFDAYELLYSNFPLIKIFSNLLLVEQNDFQKVNQKDLIYDYFNNIHMGDEILSKCSVQTMIKLMNFNEKCIDLVCGEPWNDFIIRNSIDEYSILDLNFPSSIFQYLSVLLDNQEKLSFNQNWIANHLNKDKIKEKLFICGKRDQYVSKVQEKLKLYGFEIEVDPITEFISESKQESSIDYITVEGMIVFEDFLNFE
eukprot:gene5052-8647_t